MILAVLCAAGAALVTLGASDEGGGKNYFVEFDNAFGLTEGGDVRIGGVRVGQTSELAISDRGERPLARIALEITEPGFDSFRDDAECRIRQQSLIGEYFVDCQAGSSDKVLAEGATIPVDQTESTVPPDVLNNVLRRPYRERFRLILTELGTGLAGRPQDIQEVLRRAHPGLRETSETLEILGRQTRTIQNFITDSDTVVAQLEERKRDVARWVEEAGETAEISASRRDQLAAQFNKLPRFLGELEPTMTRLGELTDEQTPLLRDLRTAAPDLEALFTELGPFSEASRPAFRSLGRMARVGRQALDRSQEEIRTLRELAEDAGPLGKSLRQFLQSLDTRKRAINIDPRVHESAPPPESGDHTAVQPGEKTGFTGFESFWNYFYWQPLALNAFDDVNHILRVIGFESHCGGYQADPSPEDQHECASHLGPYQPGLQRADGTRWPDPTDTNNDGIPDRYADQFQPASAESRNARPTERTASSREGERGAPESPPLPGQPDLSEPQIVLPPGVQQLADELSELIGGGGAVPRDGGAPGVQAEPLLDFLLAP